MIPSDVLQRVDLSATAKLIFGAMAMESCRSGYVATISHAALALITGVSRSQVFECMKVLRDKGLIEAKGQPIKQVQAYKLQHPRFVVDLAAQSPVKDRAQVANRLLPCANCRQKCKGLMKTGLCRTCTHDLKLNRRIDEKLDERDIPRRVAS